MTGTVYARCCVLYVQGEADMGRYAFKRPDDQSVRHGGSDALYANYGELITGTHLKHPRTVVTV